MFGSIFQLIGDHWLLALVAVAILAVAAFAPALGLAVLRWLVGTELGRYLLLAVLVIGAAHWAWEARFSAGYDAAVADQARAAESARADAAELALSRDDTAADIGAKTEAETAQRIEQGNEASQAAQERIGERIEQAPAVGGCAGPDPAIVRDVADADARLHAAADRLRRMGAAAAGATPADGGDGLAPVGADRRGDAQRRDRDHRAADRDGNVPAAAPR